MKKIFALAIALLVLGLAVLSAALLIRLAVVSVDMQEHERLANRAERGIATQAELQQLTELTIQLYMSYGYTRVQAEAMLQQGSHAGDSQDLESQRAYEENQRRLQ